MERSTAAPDGTGFADQLIGALRVLLLRTGRLGGPNNLIGFDIRRMAGDYRRLGVEVSPDRRYDVPSLEGASCPMCREALVLGEVSEEIDSYVDDGYDTPTTVRYLTSSLTCPNSRSHLCDAGIETRVTLQGTVLDHLTALSGIVAEG